MTDSLPSLPWEAAWLSPGTFNSALALSAVALATGFSAWLLARLAARGRLLDSASGQDAYRKLQTQPVPAVGGLAIAVGLGLAQLFAGGLSEPDSQTAGLALLPALALALTLGWIDDWRRAGLDWRAKLCGQTLVALTLIGPELAGALARGELPGSSALLFAAVCLVAQNAFNTFDNSDGAATGLGLIGLAGVSNPAAAAVLGFLPFNAFRRGSGAPRAYLGDAGSHVLGVLIAAFPAAWPVLALPVLDLVRVSAVRWRAGQAPWVGDRRHLAHRFEAAGWPQTVVLLGLCVIATPAVLAARLGYPLGGLSLTALLFGLALSASAEPEQYAPETAFRASSRSRSPNARAARVRVPGPPPG